MKFLREESLLVLRVLIVLGLLLGVGCSSSKPKDADDSDIIPTTDGIAGTDAVPQPMDDSPDSAAMPGGTDPMANYESDPAASTEDPNAVPADTSSYESSSESGTSYGDSSTDTSTDYSTSGSGQTESYTVVRGDTLMKIAFENYGDVYRWKDIYEANRDVIKDPNTIPSGTVLKIEKPSSPVSVDRNGEKYLIRQGDTLGTISSALYGSSSKWKQLWENNKQLIKNPNKIFAGFYLYYTPDTNSSYGTSSSAGSAGSTESAYASPDINNSGMMGEQNQGAGGVDAGSPGMSNGAPYAQDGSVSGDMTQQQDPSAVNGGNPIPQ